MRIIVEPIPRPEDIPELQPLLSHKDDMDFVSKLLESLTLANENAKNGGLAPALYEALPFPGMNGWPTTFDEYVYYLVVYSRWIPHQSGNSAFLDPDSPIPGEHQEVYDYLCWFYWLIDQPLASLDGGVLQDIPWFAEFLVGWADVWGHFLDTTASWNDQMLQSFIDESPEYRVQDSMIPDERRPGKLRPNNPSGWLTFNQFFARELNPGLRPVAYPFDNTTITAPADCTYMQSYQIDEQSNITPPILLKGTHTYANIKQLLSGSKYADCFAGGQYVHMFLGPYSYHRFHTPVAGIVKECYPLTGQAYLEVSLDGGQFDAADSAEDGYEFTQIRGVITIDTTDSPYGDIGIVAVIPVGMCQVSGVNMTHAVDTPCGKGDEFGYFTFGGSDIIVLTQKGTNPVYNPAFVPNTSYYSLYGTPIATVTSLKP